MNITAKDVARRVTFKTKYGRVSMFVRERPINKIGNVVIVG